MLPQHSLDHFIQPVSAASCCEFPKQDHRPGIVGIMTHTTFPTLAKVPPRTAGRSNALQGFQLQGNLRLSVGKAWAARVRTPSALGPKFLDLVLLVLQILSMASWAGFSTEQNEPKVNKPVTADSEAPPRTCRRLVP